MGIIVDKRSATMNLPGEREKQVPIDADHSAICKFDSPNSGTCELVLGTIAAQIKRALELAQDNRDPHHTPDHACLPCYHIPMPQNQRFIGREGTLDTLKRKLFLENEARTVALVGLGGVGKTQVALQLAHWVKVHKPEYSVFWVPALSEATFEQAYTEIAKKLAIHKSSGDGDPKDLVRQHLSSSSAGRWLLVVDNADDGAVVFGDPGKGGGARDYLPESEDGLTLFTTRSREVAVDVAGSDVVELDEMNSEDATSLLQKSLIRKNRVSNGAEVNELLAELTYLPLAIAQAAAYLNRNQVSVAEYLKLLRGTEQDMVSLMSREFRDSTRYEGTQNAIATTWLVSFDHIRKSDSTAADLLAFISYIEPKSIPQSILPGCQSEEQIVHAIGTLRAYAFLSKRGESKMYDMHSLVHMATRIWVSKRGLAIQEAGKAIRHVAKVFPSDDYENRSLWREYMPHSIRMLQGPEGRDVEERYNLSYWTGRCLRVDGRIKESVWCLEQCQRWWVDCFDEDHPSRLASQHTLAIAYQANGQVKKAVELLEHVVEVRERVLTEDHPDRLASQHVLAGVYQANGQVKKAVELLEHVVEVQEKILTEDHPDRLASQHVLAGVYQANGQVKKAVELLEHVVEVRERILTEDHPDRLASQHALSIAYQANGQVKKAVELLEHVVEVQEKILTEGHPDRLTSQHALVWIRNRLACERGG
ncbi:P-loop containing nucleoside triphosphate hydrolase protein [Lasiosphaeris hirsuta]|uniref:P-loop containing nucleoside triphosphate hydrolase protein n=1 Tax=Lasiosphaeris hirsuta TaxID=260670 RepID=A0AA39ZXS7_9PEZI|nr:P-loop containing nucleoside triphosphate hydrolase protein [Lasiosphaeris hirsuta]